MLPSSGDLSPVGVPHAFETIGLTFDDVLLQPAESDIAPSEVSTESQVSKRIAVKVPLISSPMDTVTEARMAVAIARQGGIGIIHRNLSIEDQAHQVDVVKRSEAGMIDEPITISPNATIREADAMRQFSYLRRARCRPRTAAARPHHQPGHALRDRSLAAGGRGDDADATDHRSGRHQPRRRDAATGPEQDREVATRR